MEEKFISIAQRAETLAATNNWETVFKETIGSEGMISALTMDEREQFYRSDWYRAILQTLTDLRSKNPKFDSPQSVITVRLPSSMHESLVTESYARRTSLNQLCISKLLQGIDDDLVASNSRLNHAASGSDVDHPASGAQPT